MTALNRLAALLGLATTPAVSAGNIAWPDLPKTGFQRGRPATVDDAKVGNAVFSLNGKSKGALPVEIPQYAFWTDGPGDRPPMILVQAERAPDSSEIVGLRDFAGHETAATMPEITLLGTKKPN